MSDIAFFDTNVLVYIDDSVAPWKQAIALDLWAAHFERNRAAISLQVLQEYYSVTTRKFKTDAELAQRKVELFAQARVVKFDERDVIAAIEIHRLNRVSFWDAMILHAAALSGATVLYSEDLNPGFQRGGIRVVNPFAESPRAKRD
jgi:predicted nucleic acid-binding protein